MVEISLDWACSQEQYDSLFDQIEQSNMLQHWLYGEAKHAAEGWQVRRAIIRNGQTPVAIVQAISKKISFMHVYRINRGPLLLDKSEETANLVQTAIRKHFSIFKGRILMWAPEKAGLEHGFRCIHWKKNPWRSAWVPLQRSEEDIRSSLNGKWRNQLLKAQKNGVTINDSDTSDEFEWLVTHHLNERAQKGFPGLNPDLIKNLRLRGLLKVITAYFEGTPVGGIIVAKHGTSTTYLIGYNDQIGRKLNANNLLLYHCLLDAKKSHLWFDVGGLGEHLQGINNFKQGLNGQEYSRFGEFIVY